MYRAYEHDRIIAYFNIKVKLKVAYVNPWIDQEMGEYLVQQRILVSIDFPFCLLFEFSENILIEQ